jgi:hypothetical protein
LAITAAGAGAGGGGLVVTRFTSVERPIMHPSVPHAVLGTLIITAGVVTVVLGWLVLRYFAQRDRNSREIIELLQDRRDVHHEYKDKLFRSTRYVLQPTEATKENEKSPVPCQNSLVAADLVFRHR